jgi:hypothetical protein
VPSGPVLLLVVLALIAFGLLLGAGMMWYVYLQLIKTPEHTRDFLSTVYQHWKESDRISESERRTCPACGHTKDFDNQRD